MSNSLESWFTSILGNCLEVDIFGDHLIEDITRLCELAKSYSVAKRAIRSSDNKGMKILHHLKRISAQIERELLQDSKYSERFMVRFSKGRSNMPKVFYVVILPKGRKAYEFMSIAICFDVEGRGFVCGLMESASIRQGWAETVDRSTDEGHCLDVNGPKPNTRYNDRFVNPKEFLLESFSEAELMNHLAESIDLLVGLVKKHLGYEL